MPGPSIASPRSNSVERVVVSAHQQRFDATRAHKPLYFMAQKIGIGLAIGHDIVDSQNATDGLEVEQAKDFVGIKVPISEAKDYGIVGTIISSSEEL